MSDKRAFVKFPNGFVLAEDIRSINLVSSPEGELKHANVRLTGGGNIYVKFDDHDAAKKFLDETAATVYEFFRNNE